MRRLDLNSVKPKSKFSEAMINYIISDDTLTKQAGKCLEYRRM